MRLSVKPRLSTQIWCPFVSFHLCRTYAYLILQHFITFEGMSSLGWIPYCQFIWGWLLGHNFSMLWNRDHCGLSIKFPPARTCSLMGVVCMDFIFLTQQGTLTHWTVSGVNWTLCFCRCCPPRSGLEVMSSWFKDNRSIESASPSVTNLWYLGLDCFCGMLAAEVIGDGDGLTSIQVKDNRSIQSTDNHYN